MAENTAADPLSDVSKLISGEYLKAKDVEAGPLTFGILRAEMETFKAKGEKKAETRLVLTLEGDPLRKLSLNQTNIQTLMDAWGKDARRWVGKCLDAFFDKSVRDPSGKLTGGLRVRVREAVLVAGGPRPGAGANGSGLAETEQADDSIPF